MWLFTDSGFVSVVQDWDTKDLLVARARDKTSLEELSTFAEASIEETPHRDYPDRVSLTREALAGWLVRTVDHLHYNNYKARMWHTRGEQFSEPLHEVWAAMHGVTPGKNSS